MTHLWVLPPAIALLFAQGVARGQSQARARPEASVPRAGNARQSRGQGTDTNRAQLQRRFQQTLYQMTRRRVGLSDDQMKRLVPINRRYETQRRGIQREERDTRLALRSALRDSARADQSRISGYLDKLVQLQRRRVDLVEQEQRELAQFMTPSQRARYTALQEQLRRRIEQLRRGAATPVDTGN
jgi:hypothetical protein